MNLPRYLNKIRKNESAFIESVTSHQEYIISQLGSVYEKYVKAENDYVSKSEKIMEYFEFKKFLFTPSTANRDSESYNQELIKCGLPPNIKMIKKLAQKMSYEFPHFWKNCSFCLSQIGQAKSTQKLQNKIIAMLQEVIDLFVVFVNTVVRPDDESGEKLLSRYSMKWKGTFAQRTQLWSPFIISQLNGVLASMGDIDSTFLEKINELLTSTKAISTIKLGKLASQIIRVIKTMCDPGCLKIADGGTSYSVVVDYYTMIAMNTANILQICFESKEYKQSVIIELNFLPFYL